MIRVFRDALAIALAGAILIIAAACLTRDLPFSITWRETNGAQRHDLSPGLPVAALANQPVVTSDESTGPLRVSPLIDSQVRPVALFEPVTTAVAVAAVGATVDTSLAKIEQGDFAWAFPGDNSELRLLTKGPIKLSGTGDQPTKLVKNGTEIANPQITGGWVATVDDLKSGRSQITVIGTNRSFTFNVLVPTVDSPTPTLSKYSNNRYGGLDLIPSNHATNPVSVYAQFLRVGGHDGSSGNAIHIAAFAGVGNGRFELKNPVLVIGPVERLPANDWHAAMRLPDLGPNPGRIFAQFWDAATGEYRVAGPLSTELHTFNPPATTLAPASNANRTREGVWLSPSRKFEVTGTADLNGVNSIKGDVRVVISIEGTGEIVGGPVGLNSSDTKWTTGVTLPGEGTYSLVAKAFLGDTPGTASPTLVVRVNESGPEVTEVVPTNFAFSSDGKTLAVRFAADRPLQLLGESKAADEKHFILTDSRGTTLEPTNVEAISGENTIKLTFSEIPRPDAYTLAVNDTIMDIFGNKMKKSVTFQIISPLPDTPATVVAPGIPGPTGPYVPFPEFVKQNPPPPGFNPSGHVETRVSRMYYYRDAHRVAQIVNRNVKSYNRAAVTMQQQLADKARQIADQATDDRKSRERQAEQSAREARELESQQSAKQTAITRLENAAYANGQAVARLEAELRVFETDPDTNKAKIEETKHALDDARANVKAAENAAAETRDEFNRLADDIQRARASETQAREQWQVATAVEDRAREEQFRREVAAANADPDTYAPGVIDSPDAVEQVSISVIGEGLIQLRGPLKGINEIRLIINQIDAPVGQVRVGVHTVQINGERGDRMERVAAKIQAYIDHSRFLTTQSSEMLRKAIVTVAARKAQMCGEIAVGSQQERDVKYLYSFFGEDFIRELESLDSEFLMTGNKLLSLNSMDSTSLASALFLMALAKNSTRLEILDEFNRMMQFDLPAAEQRYLSASLAGNLSGRRDRFGRHHNEFQLLACNARFESLQGFFDVGIDTDDTLNPVQREFIKLAQIFKSQLVVEMELRQRVRERALIEERTGDPEMEAKEARKRDDDAQVELQNARRALLDANEPVLSAAQDAGAVAAAIQKRIDRSIEASRFPSNMTRQLPEATEKAVAMSEEEKTRLFNGNAKRNLELQAMKKAGAADLARTRAILRDPLLLKDEEQANRSIEAQLLKLKQNTISLINDFGGAEKHTPRKYAEIAEFTLNGRHYIVYLVLKTGDVIVESEDGHRFPPEDLDKIIASASTTAREQFKALQDYPAVDQVLLARVEELLAFLETVPATKPVTKFLLLDDILKTQNALWNSLKSRLEPAVCELNKFIDDLRRTGGVEKGMMTSWTLVEQVVPSSAPNQLRGQLASAFADGRAALKLFIKLDLQRQNLETIAEGLRRPLDHRKFLDMLIDDMQDKNIELLEGTRAHTANIDAYIKRLATALDDDFNTQFYYPAFRQVRTASRLWDVTLGQVETTNVLANNRGFAKVEPQATMEFDLPKRNIVIAEALDASKAMIDTYGALLQDPTFIALGKLNSGQSVATPAMGTTAGLPVVRSVLPGLSTDTQESILGEHGPGRTSLAAPLEALIPDPAIYKFETGTGWEIRPVIQPDGQSVVFDFNYMYSTNVREPVRADEKHLGRIKRHFVHSDVQLGNYELREVSRYTVALKASRTGRGVPLLEDVPIAGVLFRPLPSDESSLQQNIILSQATIFPTLFDLMGLRWAPAVADLDPLRTMNEEFVVRNRNRVLNNRVFDHSSSEVDRFLRIPEGERRMDLYRSQETIPVEHPNGYIGPGANLKDSHLREGYTPLQTPSSTYVPGSTRDLRRPLPQQGYEVLDDRPVDVPLRELRTPEVIESPGKSLELPASEPLLQGMNSQGRLRQPTSKQSYAARPPLPREPLGRAGLAPDAHATKPSQRTRQATTSPQPIIVRSESPKQAPQRTAGRTDAPQHRQEVQTVFTDQKNQIRSATAAPAKLPVAERRPDEIGKEPPGRVSSLFRKLIPSRNQ